MHGEGKIYGVLLLVWAGMATLAVGIGMVMGGDARFTFLSMWGLVTASLVTSLIRRRTPAMAVRVVALSLVLAAMGFVLVGWLT